MQWILVALIGGALVTWGSLKFWQRPSVNVLLVTLDTTRADRLGCYGYSSARTPTLDALSDGGVLCERAYTVAPLTLPAHVSLMTGLYPAESGVRTNGRGRLDESIPTLAEILKRQSYETSAFIASFVLDGKFGLGRGFDFYDDDFGGDESDSNPLHRQRPGDTVVDAALAWLNKPRSRPFFCWVHLYDPHVPYFTHSDLFQQEFAEQPYDAEIAFVDRQVGRLNEFLVKAGLAERTLVVVVGDHGESLDEHLEETHGLTLYDATMRVPLIFRLPARLPAKKRIASNLSLVDVPPTVLDLVGVRNPAKMTGKSLWPTIVGNAPPPSPCFGATDDPFLFNGWSPLRSLTFENWKYIRTTRVELYDLAADPGELHNLAGSLPEQLREMESRLGELESQLVIRDESKIQLSPSDRRALASLGYIGAANPAGKGSTAGTLPDVKDMLAYDTSVQEANNLIATGAINEGIDRLRTVVREAPTLLNASWTLGLALRVAGKPDEALEVFRTFLRHKPESPHGHLGAAIMLMSLNRPGDAIAELRQCLEIDPELVDAHFNLAKALLSTGQLPEALSQLGSVLSLDPRHAEAYQYRAFLYGQQGDTTKAIADYRQALKYAPHSANAHHNLGILLADNGRNDEAIFHLGRAVELAPHKAELHSALGRFLVRLGRYDEAITHLTRALQLKPGFPPAEEGLREAIAGQKK